MKKAEIRRLIRKLSRRRHRHLKHMIYYTQWPLSYRDELSQDRQAIHELTKELDGLIAKL